jgi:hypothetical protein
MNEFLRGVVAGHPVTWQVRHIRWCPVCDQREGAAQAGLCVRCEADARLLVDSALSMDS